LTPSGQTLRIKLGSSAGLAKDKETLWWLNLLEIPPVVANQKMKARTCCSWRSVRALNLFIVLPDWATAMRRPRKLTLTASQQ
jgi:chaperone protein EcpD